MHKLYHGYFYGRFIFYFLSAIKELYCQNASRCYYNCMLSGFNRFIIAGTAIIIKQKDIVFLMTGLNLFRKRDATVCIIKRRQPPGRKLPPYIYLSGNKWLLLFIFHCSLGGSQTGNRHTEWRARSIIHTHTGTELH